MKNSHATSVLGTPEFMAPELYEQHYDQGVDIYAFGMCLLEMVTLQTPYRECWNPAQVYKKVSEGVKPQALDRIADEKVIDLIAWCLSSEKERPTSRQLLESEFLTDLEGEENNETVKLFPPVSLPTKQPSMNNHSSVKQPTNNTAKQSQPAAPVVKPLQQTSNNFPQTPPSEDSTQGSERFTKNPRVNPSISTDNVQVRQSRFEEASSKLEVTQSLQQPQSALKKEFNLIELSPEPRGQKEEQSEGKPIHSFAHLRGPSVSSDAEVLDMKRLEEGAEADVEVISDDQNEKEVEEIEQADLQLQDSLVKEEDQDKVEIVVHFENKEGVQEIIFHYDLQTDSPEAVAREMVQELKLKKVQQNIIAQEIAKQVEVKLKQNDQQIQAQTACRGKLLEELKEVETHVRQISFLLANMDESVLQSWEESEGVALKKLKDLVTWKQKYETKFK